MSSIFSKLIQERLAHFVYEDDVCVGILDIRPANIGHCLVIPKQEVDEWTDLDVSVVKHLMEVAHKIGNAQKLAFDCERIGLMIAGFEVPHTHVHVIPINSMKDFEFGSQQATDADLGLIKSKIVENLTN